MILTTMAVIAQAPPVPGAVPLEQVDLLAKAWFASLQQGKLLNSAIDARARAQLTPERLKAFADRYGPLGTPSAFKRETPTAWLGYDAYVYRMEFTDGTVLYLHITFGGSNLLHILRVEQN